MPAPTLPPPILHIERTAARVVVTPGPGGGVEVVVRQVQGAPRVTVSRRGAEVVVDGGVTSAGRPGLFDAFDRARCRTDPNRLPLVIVRAPPNVRIRASGALTGEVGPSESIALTVEGCGGWTLGPVRRDLDVDTTGAVRVVVASVGGDLAARLAGRGDVVVAGGHAPSARVQVLSSGSLIHTGSVGALVADLRGSGNVRLTELDGLVDARVNGTGDVFYARPMVKRYCGTAQTRC